MIDKIKEAAEYPREDILYEASCQLAKTLQLEDLRLLFTEFSTDPVVASVLIRAVGNMEERCVERVNVLAPFISHGSVEVRDATVAALADIQCNEATDVLEAALRTETDLLIREAILDALECRKF